MPPLVWPLVVIVVVLAAVGGLVLLLRSRMREAGIFVKLRTMFGPALVFTVEGDDGEPVRVLNVGGMYQSACYLDESRAYDLVFEYTKLYDAMFEAGIPVRNACMVGGGGYSYPKHFISEHPEARMDVVEVDPAITELAWEHFWLDRLFAQFGLEESGRLGLVNEDGRAYLERRAAQVAAGEAGAYDVVLIDTFSGKEPVPALTTVEAARAVRGCLAPGGLYMANVVSALEGREARLLRALVRTLSQVFAHVYVIPCATDEFAERDNTMVIATDSACEFSGAYDVARLGVSEADPVLTDADNPVAELAG